MPEQIDYNQQVLNPIQATVQGYQLGIGLRQQQEQQQRQQMLGTAMRDLTDKIRSGTASQADFAQIAMIAPKDQSEAALKIWDSMSKERQQGVLSFGSQVMSALGSKNPQIGIDLLKERAAGERNAGNEEQARAYDTWARLAELDPVNSQAIIGGMIQGLPGGDKAIEAWDKMQQNRRAEQLQPFKLRQETAEASLKELQAKFAPSKFGSELALNQAQIANAYSSMRAHDAAAKKSGVDAVRAQAEADLMSAGIIPTEKRPEAEAKFRKEYSDQTKGYQEVKSAYGRVLASDESAVGDMSMIFSYMKMLDPGSVVREGEFATAQNAAGVPERIQNIYNRVVSGERLSPSQRTSFKGQAGKLYSTAKTQEATVRQGIERMAKGYGLSPEKIFYEPTETPPPGAIANPVPPRQATVGQPAGVSVTAPDGKVITFPSQQAADAFRKAAGVR